MGVSFAVYSFLIGLWGILSALPAHGRGDTFHVVPTQGNIPSKDRHVSDDILNINQELLLPAAPESSFLLEGDILKDHLLKSFSLLSPRWPKKNGTVQVPYVISSQYGLFFQVYQSRSQQPDFTPAVSCLIPLDSSSVKIIKEALEDFGRLTCVKFIPYSYQKDFVSIAPLSGCFSSIGRVGGMQLVSLAPACLRRGKGIALHEFMHVLGFWHEHVRADRDKYIKISWDEVLTGFERNFMKSWSTNMLVEYDYSSVMHYARNAFSITGSPTIIPLSASDVLLGQRENLSHSDIARVNRLYGCPQGDVLLETPTEGAGGKNFTLKEHEAKTTAGKAKFSATLNPTIPTKGTLSMTKDFGMTNAQTRSGQDHNTFSTLSLEKVWESQNVLMATGELLHKTQPRGMEAGIIGTSHAPELDLSPFIGPSPEVLQTEVIPTPVVPQSLSETETLFTEQSVEPLTAVETGSRVSGKGNEFVSPTKTPPLQASLHQTLSSLMEDTQTKAAQILKTKTTASRVVGSEETLASEAGSLMSSAVLQSQGGTAEKKAESFSTKKGTVPSSTLPQHSAGLLESGTIATKQSLVSGNLEVPKTSSWAAVPGHLAESRPKQVTSLERSSAEHSMQMRQFSPLPARRGRKGFRWRLLGTKAPPGSVLGPGARAELAATVPHTFTFPELPSETWHLVPMVSGAHSHSWATTKGSSLHPSQTRRIAEPIDKVTLLQQSNTLKYGSGAFLPGWVASTGVQAERLMHTTETAPITTELIGTSGEDIGVRLLKEARANRRTTLSLLFHAKPLGSQELIQPEEGVAETQGQQSSLSVGFSPTAARSSETESLHGQSMVTSQRHCELVDLLPEAKTSYLKHTTKHFASLGRQSKSEATSQPSPFAKSKEPDLSVERKSGLEENTGMTLSWTDDCSDVRDRNKIITNIPNSKKETLSPVAAMTYGKSPEITTTNKQALPFHPPSLSSTLTLGRPTLRGSQIFSLVGGAGPLRGSKSQSTWSPEVDKEIASSKRKELSPLVEGGGTAVPGNTIKEISLTWAGSPVQMVGRNSREPPYWKHS